MHDENQRERTLRLRRHAIQIVAQLPESEDEAVRVLHYARQIVTGFLSMKEDVGECQVLAFKQACRSDEQT